MSSLRGQGHLHSAMGRKDFSRSIGNLWWGTKAKTGQWRPQSLWPLCNSRPGPCNLWPSYVYKRATEPRLSGRQDTACNKFHISSSIANITGGQVWDVPSFNQKLIKIRQCNLTKCRLRFYVFIRWAVYKLWDCTVWFLSAFDWKRAHLKLVPLLYL